jgi:hypothetical protein
MMSNLINRYNLFPTPVWHFEMPNWKEVEYDTVEYLMQDSVYFTQLEKNGVQTSDGDLHIRHDKLNPVRDFLQSSFEEVMDTMGYDRKCGLTTMWATRARAGGNHHEHIHRNTFLACVFYAFDSDNNAYGTAFKNPQSNLYQLSPRAKEGSREMLTNSAVMPFEVGTCVIFPAWAVHYTYPSPSRCRIIIGANSMPIGKSNTDHYNQYDFPDPADIGYMNLEEHIANGYKRR